MMQTLKKLTGHMAQSRLFSRVFSFLCVFALFLTPLALSTENGIHLLNAEAANPIKFFTDPLGYLKQSFVDLLLVITAGILRILVFFASLSSKFFTLAADYSTRGSVYADLPFITVGWTFIRDLVNSTFIFIVLFAAFKELLTFNSPATGRLQDLAVKITIAALLINFSLFFTKVGIDASNYLSRTLVCRMQVVDTSVNPPIRTCDPGEVLVAGLRLHTFDFSNMGEANPLLKASLYGQTDVLMNTVFSNIGGILVSIIAIIAFFSAAFMFMARIFILVIIMVFSPLMFAATALNFRMVKEMQAKWKSEFYAQLSFPLIFLLTIYLAVRFIRLDGFVPKGGENTGGTFSFAEAFVGTPNAFPIILNYGFVIIIMLVGLKAARAASGTAKVMGDKTSSLVANKTLAMAGALGRQTAGRFAKSVAESDKLKAWSQKSGFNRFVGDKVMRGANKVSGSSFDMRNSKAFGSSFGTVGKQLGVGFEKGSNKNFTKDGKSIAAIGPSAMRQISADLGFKMSKTEEEALTKNRSAKLIEKYGYSGEMLATYAKSEFGDKLMDKEHKDLREEIVKKIRDEHKKDPGAAVTALKRVFGDSGTGSEKKNTFATNKEFKAARQELAKDMLEALKENPDYKDKHKEIEENIAAAFGKDEYEKSKDFEEIRGQLKGEISKERLKGSAKDYIKAFDELNKQKALVAADDPSLIPLKEKLAAQAEAFQKASLNAKPEVIADLAAADIDKLHSQLKKAHILAIQKKRATPGGYSGQTGDKTEEQLIDEMMQKMLIDGENANPILSEYIATELIKDTSPFDIDLAPSFGDLLVQKNLASSLDDRARLEKQTKRLVQAMRPEHLLKVSHHDILRPEVIPNIHPNSLFEFRQALESQGKTDAIAELEATANQIENQSISAGTGSFARFFDNDNQKKKTVAALRGKNPNTVRKKK